MNRLPEQAGKCRARRDLKHSMACQQAAIDTHAQAWALSPLALAMHAPIQPSVHMLTALRSCSCTGGASAPKLTACGRAWGLARRGRLAGRGRLARTPAGAPGPRAAGRSRCCPAARCGTCKPTLACPAVTAQLQTAHQESSAHRSRMQPASQRHAGPAAQACDARAAAVAPSGSPGTNHSHVRVQACSLTLSAGRKTRARWCSPGSLQPARGRPQPGHRCPAPPRPCPCLSPLSCPWSLCTRSCSCKRGDSGHGRHQER